MMTIANPNQMLAFIGSYASPDTPGVYSCTYDAATGQFAIIDQVSGLADPTFLTVDRNRRMLYAIGSVLEEGRKVGEAYSYRILDNGELAFVNKQRTVGPTCHITLDHTSRCLIVSSYHGGMIGICPILEDGSIGPIREVHQHEGSSVHPNQASPHPHSVFIDRNNRYALCCDLGIDQVIVYRLDVDGCRLIPHSKVHVQPGSGPRHLTFHPTLPYVYVINELNGTVTVFAYDEGAGTLSEVQTISTLPADYTGEPSCADIHISNDGRFLYGSNRGHDSIVVYTIDQANGQLSPIEYVSTQGGHPRNFALSPDNRFVLVANRDANNVVTLARDAETGRLTPAGTELHVSKPVCVKFFV
jgi:6-phosphogluconolactonase